MASDAKLDPRVMASTISNARLNALQSGDDLDSFFQKSKDCIDAYTQAIKAMIEDASVRVKNGEEPPFDEIVQMKERFFKYCQTIVEEALALVARARAARHLQQTAVSISSTLPSLVSSTSTPACSRLSGRDRLRLYTVSSDDWVMVPSMPSPTSPTKIVAPDNMDPVEGSIHLGAIVRIFGKVGSPQCFFLCFLLLGGVTANADFLLLARQFQDWSGHTGSHAASKNVRTQEMAVLIDIVQNLYYALYARLTIEMASIDLCGSFPIDARRCWTPPKSVPSFEKTSSPTSREAYIDQPQEEKRHLFTPDRDEYRQFALTTVSRRRGSYCEKWGQLIPFFNSVSAETMASLSQKYLLLSPWHIPRDDIPFGDLPWLTQAAVGMEVWDSDVVNERHLSERARINGTGMGDERKKEPILIFTTMSDKESAFACLHANVPCTVSTAWRTAVVRNDMYASWRPSVDLHTDGMADLLLPLPASTIARKFFDGLAELKRDVKDDVIASELENAFEFFAQFIPNERLMTPSERSGKSS
ncbi:hypothetical protein N7497_012373 [Penicillium chrysogenum]|nr:hypothetical protein N7497_012373 [Penicillium chrysogenum]